MELRHLRYFVAVASHGSFNRAAEILNLTQPPLSRQVKDLEEELGVTLLVRGSNSVKLTEAGELFYEEAREVLARADEAVRRVRGESGKEILRVGYSSSIAKGITSTVLAKFQEAAPRVRIELADLSSREMNEMAVARLHHLPLVGLAKDHYPEYVPAARALLKPHGISPNFVSLVNDNFSTVLVEVDAQNAAAILLEGIVGMLPQTLVARPFVPKLASVPVVVGLPALSPKPHAVSFARLLIEESRNR